MFWKIVLIFWQLPQNILGSILWLILRKRITTNKKEKFNNIFYVEGLKGAVSLGYFIFVNPNTKYKIVQHELGHGEQSRALGWWYLIIIGIPSFTWATLRHFGLFLKYSYWSFYPESWANRLAGVEL